MTRTILKSVFVLALAAMAASGAIAKERTPAGSFLNYRATTVQELIDQISSDTKTKARYEKHFGVGEQQLIQYFKGMELVSLKSALKVQTWYVNTKGVTRKKTKLLPKGTLVFANQQGKPILQWSCGNPLSTSLPQPIAKVAGSSEVAAAGGQGDTTSAVKPVPMVTDTPETKVLANPIETVAAAAITVPPGFVEQVGPAIAGAAPVAAIPAVEAVALPPVAAAPVISSGGGFGLGWLGGVAGLAGALAFAGGGGGGGTTPTPVPEPATLATLACGLVTLAASVRRRRR